MRDTLEKLVKQHEELRAMRKSVDDYAQKHGAMVQEFLVKELGIPKEGEYSLVELLKKAVDKQ